MRFHSVLLSALEFSWKGLSENFPFAKNVCKNDSFCSYVVVVGAVVELAVALGREVGQRGESLAGHSYLFPASSLQGRGHPRGDGESRKEKRGHTTE